MGQAAQAAGLHTREWCSSGAKCEVNEVNACIADRDFLVCACAVGSPYAGIDSGLEGGPFLPVPRACVRSTSEAYGVGATEANGDTMCTVAPTHSPSPQTPTSVSLSSVTGVSEPSAFQRASPGSADAANIPQASSQQVTNAAEPRPMSLESADFETIGSGSDFASAHVAVRAFSELLIGGVIVCLHVDGCGALDVEARLDSRLSTLSLAFNGVEKHVPLTLIQQVSVDRPGPQPEETGGETDAEQTWLVHVQVQGGRSCAFIFEGSAAGYHEACYFGDCLRMLADGARFSQVDGADGLPRFRGSENTPKPHGGPQGKGQVTSKGARPTAAKEAFLDADRGTDL